jgi:hypothetical protein
VWTSVVDHWDEVGYEDDYVSVARVARDGLEKHPWSLGGGGASELKELLEERAEKRLGDVVAAHGRLIAIGRDRSQLERTFATGATTRNSACSSLTMKISESSRTDRQRASRDLALAHDAMDARSLWRGHVQERRTDLGTNGIS